MNITERSFRFLTLLFVCLMIVGGGKAYASAVILSPDENLALGVHDEGHLNTSDPNGIISTSNSGKVGIASKFVDGETYQDATAPGCTCEGWGVSASGVSGHANDADSIVNLTVDSFTSSANSATSVVHLTSLPGLQVTQAYAPSAGAPNGLFEDKVTITNNTDGTLTDVRYVRVMDWDVPPTEFSEYVTIQGVGTTSLLERSHNNGFATADPLGSESPSDGSTLNADFVDNGPSDHGAYFRFNFGSLAAGESVSFRIFYGAAPNEAAALDALSAVGAELFSLGQSNGGQVLGTPATYIFGFSGVGGVGYVDCSETLTITNQTLPSAPVGTNYGFTLSVTGGDGPYTWSIVRKIASDALVDDPDYVPTILDDLTIGESSGLLSWNPLPRITENPDPQNPVYYIDFAIKVENGEDCGSATFRYTDPDAVISSGGEGGGGGCFIATAAYGSYLHPDVNVLKRFRDRYLLTNMMGSLFVNTYYRLSPPAADYIAKHDSMRTATRIALTPLVYGIKYPSAAFIIFGSAVVFAGYRWRKRRLS